MMRMTKKKKRYWLIWQKEDMDAKMMKAGGDPDDLWLDLEEEYTCHINIIIEDEGRGEESEKSRGGEGETPL
jgi:hypothetical protein